MTKFRTMLATGITVVALGLAGCGITRDNYSASEYVDDATITSKIKADFVTADKVSAPAISVETMNGTVLLSGFARDAAAKAKAEEIARQTKGVKSVKNAIVLRN